LRRAANDHNRPCPLEPKQRIAEMQKSIKSKAEQQFAAAEKKTKNILQARDKSEQDMKERMAKQRALRLAKEQDDMPKARHMLKP
jgi:hypothetical protein